MAKWPEFRPSRILTSLVARGVDFVVIGGYAAIAHGSTQLTNDLDICFAPDEGNLRALGKALTELGATLRGVEEEVPLVPDHRTLAHVQLLTLDTNDGPLDVLAAPRGAPDYPVLRRRATRVEVAGVSVLIASLDDLKRMKLAAGRTKDLIALEELEEIERLGRLRRRTQRERDAGA